ncbi:hypothetical protein TI39_contig610g00005 [Zymoseptoria brevis]|uniref:BTB domain-containing protein n=1 Tax=Zymoseptoria brevis TaxID=1047168 RepID=A0A0F4GGQ6_9PEZI|nr:hypothetical protein TI39_contig610g00005 [Zymoseptoria brevis]
MTPPPPSNSAGESSESERAASPAATDEPRAKRYKFGASITILAGWDKQPFKVDEDEVCAKSGFVASACSTSWKEGQEKVIRVEDVKPRVMEQYINWVYKDKVPLASEFIDEEIDGDAEYKHHVELYLAAQLLQDDVLQILLIDSLLLTFPRCGEVTWGKLVKKVWPDVGFTMKESELRRLMIDTTLFCAESGETLFDWLQPDSQPIDFVHSVGQRAVQGLGKPKDTLDPKSNDKCYYHDHEDGEKCGMLLAQD